MTIASAGVLAATAVAALNASPAIADPAGAGVITDPVQIALLHTAALNDTLLDNHGQSGVCTAFCKSTVVTAGKGASNPLLSIFPIGLGADDLQKAFELTGAPSRGGTVTIIGLGSYPHLESDLNAYRSRFNLGACTQANGCLSVHNYQGGDGYGQGAFDVDYSMETAIDVQMASAACPQCKITYLEVPLANATPTGPYGDLINQFSLAVQTAVRLGTSSISISYGIPTSTAINQGALSQRLVQRGTPIFVAAGDEGYQNPRQFQTGSGGWPQNLQSVVSVGGVELRRNIFSSTGFSQRVWNDNDGFATGSGCSPDLEPANGQPANVAANCNGHRATTDMSAIADNVAIYYPRPDSFGNWQVTGGTSAASPFLAGIAARAPRIADAVGPNFIYSAPDSAFTDVTQGSNGTAQECQQQGANARVCVAGPGWDGPTGRGTPKGLAPFTAG